MSAFFLIMWIYGCFFPTLNIKICELCQCVHILMVMIRSVFVRFHKKLKLNYSALNAGLKTSESLKISANLCWKEPKESDPSERMFCVILDWLRWYDFPQCFSTEFSSRHSVAGTRAQSTFSNNIITSAPTVDTLSWLPAVSLEASQ